MAELAQTIAIVVGIVTIGGLLIRTVAYALARKLEEDKRANAANEANQEDRVLELTEKELERYKAQAEELQARVPTLENKLNALRDEVGASKAIAEMRADVGKGFTSLAGLIDAHERRAQSADQRQADFNRQTARILDEIAAKLFIPSMQVTREPGQEGGG